MKRGRKVGSKEKIRWNERRKGQITKKMENRKEEGKKGEGNH